MKILETSLYPALEDLQPIQRGLSRPEFKTWVHSGREEYPVAGVAIGYEFIDLVLTQWSRDYYLGYSLNTLNGIDGVMLVSRKCCLASPFLVSPELIARRYERGLPHLELGQTDNLFQFGFKSGFEFGEIVSVKLGRVEIQFFTPLGRPAGVRSMHVTELLSIGLESVAISTARENRIAFNEFCER